MNIKTVLARLHSTLGLDARIDRLLLLPLIESSSLKVAETSPTALLVGYDGSANSQAALDLAFCVAHQMQLATQQQVMLHVVYVVDCDTSRLAQSRRAKRAKSNIKSKTIKSKSKKLVSQPASVESTVSCGTAILSQSDIGNRNLEEIDRVLWQARCLAEEWRGSFTTHLRFGNLAAELEAFAAEENAALLFLGCHSASHPLVQQLKGKISCSVIGIPQFSPVQCPV